jgi:hypothetical protein
MSQQKPTKSGNSQKSKGAGKGKKSPKSKSDRPPVGDLPHYSLFTKEQASFVDAAKALSGALVDQFGPTASISMLEKALIELEKAPVNHRSMVWIPHSIIDLYNQYRLTLEARQEQLRSFRSERSVQNISSALAFYEKVISENSEIGEEEEERELDGNRRAGEGE